MNTMVRHHGGNIRIRKGFPERHMTADAPAGGIHRANFPSYRLGACLGRVGRMALQTDRLICPGIMAGIGMRSVAGNAGKLSLPLGEAGALHQAIGLEALSLYLGNALLFGKTLYSLGGVAFAAKLIDLGSAPAIYLFHVQVCKIPSLHGSHMRAAGTVAGLAADPQEALLRHQRMVGQGDRVAEDALAGRIALP